VARGKSFDTHGRSVAETEAIFHRELDRVRLARKAETITFITGVGKNRDRLAELARQAGLVHYVPWANNGMIVIEFE
jgi:hypothetical protein